jgi:hypothetical protein
MSRLCSLTEESLERSIK